MADDDEIDILGDFSFNSCFALNNQGIPSCSDREDTVHPQWLLDSPAANWYDIKNIKRTKEGPSRKLSGDSSKNTSNESFHIAWTEEERKMLKLEMQKYGRNIKKISQSLTTKSEAEIQALIEAEHGIQLDNVVWEKHDDQDNVPHVGQEEIITDNIDLSDVINMVTTGSPTIPVPKKGFRNGKIYKSNKMLKPSSKKRINLKKTQHEDISGPILESLDTKIELNKNSINFMKQKEKVKTIKKLGNHRRKVARNFDKGRIRTSSKEIKSPLNAKTDPSLSEDSTKSPKMQIVLGSGQALPVSEGEQVIKIEKKKDSEESDIDVDIDSDVEEANQKKTVIPVISDSVSPHKSDSDSAPIAVPLRRLEMPRRRRKINLDGGGGYRILHTENGDVYEMASEPRKERQPRKQPVQLIRCREYDANKPAPCKVQLQVSALVGMAVHAHTSRAEVMGLVGGRAASPAAAAATALRLCVCAYRPASAAANATHCDMDPVSQAQAGEQVRERGLAVVGWHHSHPAFAAAPSVRDLRTQRDLQAALDCRLPFLALLTSQRPPPPYYSCFRVEDTEEDSDTPIGYQLHMELIANITAANVAEHLQELRNMLENVEPTEHSVDMNNDICPHAGVSYLDKCIWAVSRHMREAGYESDDLVVKQLIQGIRDIFR